MSNGIKHDKDKPRTDLLSTIALLEISKVMGYGVKKYAAHNWRGGIEWSRVLGAALRHILAFNNGEDKDPETGFSHLAHAGCCLMFLLEYEQTHKELDDRYKTKTTVLNQSEIKLTEVNPKFGDVQVFPYGDTEE